MTNDLNANKSPIVVHCSAGVGRSKKNGYFKKIGFVGVEASKPLLRLSEYMGLSVGHFFFFFFDMCQAKVSLF